jgi:hypothetical protein
MANWYVKSGAVGAANGSSWNDGIIKPYIQQGESGKTYVITMKVQTEGGDQEVWTISVSVT